jgi:hypothetical protein
VGERDLMVLASGVTERMADALERGGYRSVADVMREGDVDRMAIRTGIGNAKARELKDAIQKFVDKDLERIRAAQRANVARADAAAPAMGENN